MFTIISFIANGANKANVTPGGVSCRLLAVPFMDSGKSLFAAFSVAAFSLGKFRDLSTIQKGTASSQCFVQPVSQLVSDKLHATLLQ